MFQMFVLSVSSMIILGCLPIYCCCFCRRRQENINSYLLIAECTWLFLSRHIYSYASETWGLCLDLFYLKEGSLGKTLKWRFFKNANYLKNFLKCFLRSMLLHFSTILRLSLAQSVHFLSSNKILIRRKNKSVGWGCMELRWLLTANQKDVQKCSASSIWSSTIGS